MPHQCVRCNKIHEDTDPAVLTGCSCGAKLFFYIRKDHLKSNEPLVKLDEEQKKQIEVDVFEMIGKKDKDVPVVLDFESIRVSKPGKYEIDLVQLFKGAPLIFKIEDGKYIIDVAETFTRLRKKS